MDLAEGHVAALKYMENTHPRPRPHPHTNGDNTKSSNGYGEYSVFNLGTGVGYSVLDMVEAMKKASGR